MREHQTDTVIPSLVGEDDRAPRWQQEFPYHWDADTLVSRRELLRFAVYTSGTLFAATALLTVLGAIRQVRPPTFPTKLIGRIDQVAEGEAFYFTYPGPQDQAMLLHLPGGQFVAYSQKCTHLSCAVLYEPERSRLYCPCHDGVFNPVTGDAVAGPPRRRLPRVLLQREADRIFAVGLMP